MESSHIDNIIVVVPDANEGGRDFFTSMTLAGEV
jgi:hypothetical protein